MDMRELQLPPGAEDTLRLYAEAGIPPGSCLEAALANDFMGYFQRADEAHVAHALDVATFIHCLMPSTCHGSPAIVARWVKSMRSGAGKGEDGG